MKDGIKSKDTSLKISHSTDKTLSKNQERFNQLTEQLGLLEEDLERFSKRMDVLSGDYFAKLHPIKIENAKLQIEMAKKISEVTFTPKFGKKNVEKARIVIQDLLTQAFEFVAPDDKLQELYDSWSEVSYKEEIEEMQASQKEMTQDFMKFTFGIDVDLSPFEDTPEGQAQMRAYMEEKMKEAQQQMGNDAPKSKSKSKKKVAEEQQRRDAEAMELKSLRSIYIALAKALHPDTEVDIDKKSIKEELMKKVVAAYENKDLAELLKLEMQWIHKDGGHLEKLSEDKLKMYISFLAKKVEELKEERFHLSLHPKYQAVSFMAGYSEKRTKKLFQEAVMEQIDRGEELTKFYQRLNNDDTKNTAIQLIDMYVQSLDLYY